MAKKNDNNEVKITFKAFNADFNKGMKEMNDSTSKLRQEMKLQSEQMKNSATETEKLEASLTGLQKQYELAQQKTAATAQALEQAREQWGENSVEAQKYETKLRSMQIAEQQVANSIVETGRALDKAKSAYEEQTQSMQKLQRLFDATETSVNDFSDALGSDLSRAIQNGTASAKDLDIAFEKVSQSALGAGVDIEEVRRSLSKMDSTNVEDVRQDLEKLAQSANDAEQQVNKLGDAFNVLGGVVAGAGIAQVFEGALNASDLNSTIDIIFNVPEESKESVRQALANVKAYGVDGEEALEGLRRQWALNADATDDSNSKVVEGAASIVKAYSRLDFVELIQEVNEIAGELKMTDQEALNLVNDLLKIGFPDEQLDIIAEYGQQLKRAGYEGEQLKAILASAVATDSWNIDNLLDGLKEGRITAAEMGMGLTNSFKDAIRDVTNNTRKMSDEQISIMASGFAKQENELSRSLGRQVDAISKNQVRQQKAFDKQLQQQYDTASKSYDKQQRALDKQLQDQYDAVSKNYDNQVSVLEKRLSKEYDVTSKSYEKQQRELEKSLEKEVREFEKATNEKIALIDKEYLERLKIIDEEKYNQLKQIDNQIDALNARTDAEDKAIKQRENADKRAELKRRINEAKTSKDRMDARKALNDFERQLELDAIREQRRGQIDALKGQKDVIKESSDAQKDALKTEVDEKKTQLKEQADIEKASLKERQDEQKRLFQEQRQAELSAIQESNRNQINALREVNKARLDNLKEEQAARKEALRETNKASLDNLREEQNSRKDALRERLSNELSAVKESHDAELESFRAMNKQKLDLAKNPPDSQETKAIFDQLEEWGRAIAQGGEEGAQAFEDMTRWLDGIEDATLRNAIGMEIFKTKWEDQGENIIDTILGVDEATEQLGNTQSTVSKQMEKMGEGNALQQFHQAIEDVKVALAPLLNLIAGIIGKIAKWASENSVLASILVVVGSVIGIITGALAALSPIVLAAIGLFGGTGGLAGAFSKIVPVISGLASKILPMLRIAFGALTGPIGLIVTALTIAVPLIIKHWDKIVAFFKGLGKILLDLIKGAFNGINNFIKFILEKMYSFIRGIIDKIKGQFSFTGMVDKVKSAFGKAYDAIVSPIQRARDKISEIIEKIKGLFKFKFEWPELKIPKLKIKKGSLNPIKWFTEGFPEIDIQWFAKGGIMTKPTVFGGNGSTAFAGGEAGPEAVIPLSDRVLGAIGDAIFRASNNNNATQQPVVYNYERMLEGATFVIREEADVKKISRELYDLQQRDRKGR